MYFIYLYFNKFFKKLKKNHIIYAKVIKIKNLKVILDANLKRDFSINKTEFLNKNKLTIKLGDFVEVILLNLENKSNKLIASRILFKKLMFKKYLFKILKKKIRLKGEALKKIKKGFLILFKNVRCFLPYSFADKKFLTFFFRYKRKPLNFRIFKLNLKKNIIIVSRKLYMHSFIINNKRKFFKYLRLGCFIKGIIKSFNNSGMYIDFGHLLGFVSKRLFINKHYKYFNEILSINQSLNLKIIKLNKEKKIFTLDIKNKFSESIKIFNNLKLGDKFFIKIYRISRNHFHFYSKFHVTGLINKKFLINLSLNQYLEVIFIKFKNNTICFKPLLAQRIERWPSKS